MYDYDYSYSVDYSDAAASGMFAALFGMLAAMWLVLMIVAVISIIAQWKLFSKAGKPGWASLIPFYNSYTLFSLVYSSGWWFLLTWIPFVNLVVLVILSIDLARAFGKSTGFAIGLIFLSPIFYCILAFGGSKYIPMFKSSPFGGYENGQTRQATQTTTPPPTSGASMSQEDTREMLRRKLQEKQNSSQTPFEK